MKQNHWVIAIPRIFAFFWSSPDSSPGSSPDSSPGSSNSISQQYRVFKYDSDSEYYVIRGILFAITLRKIFKVIYLTIYKQLLYYIVMCPTNLVIKIYKPHFLAVVLMTKLRNFTKIKIFYQIWPTLKFSFLKSRILYIYVICFQVFVSVFILVFYGIFEVKWLENTLFSSQNVERVEIF
jgi:hypothetical protein